MTTITLAGRLLIEHEEAKKEIKKLNNTIRQLRRELARSRAIEYDEPLPYEEQELLDEQSGIPYLE